MQLPVVLFFRKSLRKNLHKEKTKVLSRNCRSPLAKPPYRNLIVFFSLPAEAYHTSNACLTDAGSWHWNQLICKTSQVENNDSDSSNRHSRAHLHFSTGISLAQWLSHSVPSQLWKFEHVYICSIWNTYWIRLIGKWSKFRNLLNALWSRFG